MKEWQQGPEIQFMIWLHACHKIYTTLYTLNMPDSLTVHTCNVQDHKLEVLLWN